MKRVIVELTIPADGSAALFAIPMQAQAVPYKGSYYFDYIDESDSPAPSDAIYVGEMQADGTVVDLIGAGVQDTFPHNFSGWDRKTISDTPPVITIPADKAKIMLLRAGYLSAVKSTVAFLGEEAQIAYDSAPTMSSNNPLVIAVLTSPGIGLSLDEVYQLFLSANNITY